MANPQSASEVYKVVRAQVEHVDNNLGQRVIWLVIAQSFFFGAYATLINGKPVKPELDPIHVALIKILPIAALLTVAFTYIDVITSIFYMRGLRRKYESSMGHDVSVDQAYPNITGSRAQRRFMHTSPILIPAVFIVIWIILLYVQYSTPAGHMASPPPHQ